MTLKLSRRTALAGAFGTAALAATGAPALGQASGRKPNILYIMADDLGYADLSCYGRKEYETPVLDRLASQGMMFTHAYANSAVCTATRVALITGRYQYRLPVGLHEPLGAGNVGLPPALAQPNRAEDSPEPNRVHLVSVPAGRLPTDYQPLTARSGVS